jgi:hypothetical protein
MEDRRNHRIRVLGVALLVGGLLLAQPARADHHEPVDWPLTATVETSPEGVTVEAEVSSSSNPGTAAGQSSGSGSNCSLEGPGNIGMGVVEVWSQGPDNLPYTVVCDGEAVGVVWLSTDQGGNASAPAALSPEEIAMQLREEIPIPNATIGMNPERGLVGVESWFWIEGYGGEPITESTDAFGRRVEVEARVMHYEWSFGDGKTLTTDSPGRPYPERSDVRHMYQRSSLGYPQGYTVEVGFSFSVRYRVDGGGWVGLPGIDRVAQAQYPVRESQAVISQ